MEDLGGIVIFVLFLAISLYNRYAKQGSQPEKVEKLPVPRTPQWPGPVARPLSGPVLRPQARPRAGQEASGDSVPEALGVG